LQTPAVSRYRLKNQPNHAKNELDPAWTLGAADWVRPPPTVWQGRDHFRECLVFGLFLTISCRSLRLDGPVDPELNLVMG
jgi:hypothetical protein